MFGTEDLLPLSLWNRLANTPTACPSGASLARSGRVQAAHSPFTHAKRNKKTLQNSRTEQNSCSKENFPNQSDAAAPAAQLDSTAGFLASEMIPDRRHKWNLQPVKNDLNRT